MSLLHIEKIFVGYRYTLSQGHTIKQICPVKDTQGDKDPKQPYGPHNCHKIYIKIYDLFYFRVPILLFNH